MKNFELDPRLKKDCINLGKLHDINLLLMNNSLVPWFILVPEVDKTELYELEQETQQQLYTAVNELSVFLKSHFYMDKINVGAIGNIVSQLHVHVVGRSKMDYCWPNVVWGAKGKQEYMQDEIGRVALALESEFGGLYTRRKN